MTEYRIVKVLPNPNDLYAYAIERVGWFGQKRYYIPPPGGPWVDAPDIRTRMSQEYADWYLRVLEEGCPPHDRASKMPPVKDAK